MIFFFILFNFPLRKYFFCTAPPPPRLSLLMFRPLWVVFGLSTLNLKKWVNQASWKQFKNGVSNKFKHFFWFSFISGTFENKWEKAGWKFSSAGEWAPGYRLSPGYFQKFKRMPAPDWTQKMLCIIVPNRRKVAPKFFSWVRTRRYCLDHGLSGSCTTEMNAARNISKYCLPEN